MPVVQIIRIGWANPFVRQAAMNLVIERVLPAAMTATNEKIIPVAKSVANEKVVPAAKNVASKTREGWNSLRRHNTTENHTRSSELFDVTEQYDENRECRFITVSKGLDGEFLETWYSA